MEITCKEVLEIKLNKVETQELEETGWVQTENYVITEIDGEYYLSKVVEEPFEIILEV